MALAPAISATTAIAARIVFIFPLFLFSVVRLFVSFPLLEVCCCFGHEDPAGGFNTLEKAKHYLSFGFTTGGVEEIVKFNLERLSHILPSHRDAVKTVHANGAFTVPPPQ